MLPKILQCDLDGVRRIVAELETDPTSDATIETVTKILEERCDGGRNIFHAAVTMCQPTSNREPEQDASATAGTSSLSAAASGSHQAGLAGIESIESAFGSRDPIQ